MPALFDDEDARKAQHKHLQDGGEELHAAHETPHRLVIHGLRGDVFFVAPVEFFYLVLLVGEGLGDSCARDSGFDIRVYPRYALLDLAGGQIELFAQVHDERQHEGHRRHEHERKAPVDKRHHNEGADESDRRNEEILRAVVREFNDVKQIRGAARHELARPRFIVEGEAELLQMGEYVVAHIRFDINAQHVPPVGDYVGAYRADYVHEYRRAYEYQKRAERFRAGRDVIVQRVPRHDGIDDVHRRDYERAEHIEGKELHMPPVIAYKAPYNAGLLILPVHRFLRSPRFRTAAPPQYRRACVAR